MIQPIKPFVLIEKPEPEKITVNGIILPFAKQESTINGKVIAVYDGCTELEIGQAVAVPAGYFQMVPNKPLQGLLDTVNGMFVKVG